MAFCHRAFRCCLSVAISLGSAAILAVAHAQSSAAPVEVSSVRSPDQPVSRLPLSAETQGDLLAVHQHYMDAIAAYKSAPQDSAVIANKIGVAYHHMFDMADAKRCYELAIRLNPRYAEAINNLGAVYHSEKNYKQAQRLYRKALKLNPNSPLFYSNLGTAYFFQGNTRKGAEAYRQAFALDPHVFERSGGSKIEELSSTKDLSKVNYVLAKTYAKAGMNEQALSYLKKALRQGFNDHKKLMNDPEFASLRDTPEFVRILAIEQGR